MGGYKRIIELNFEQKNRSFSQKLLNELSLRRIGNSHSPYLVIAKVFFAIFFALIIDTYISKNPDSVSSAFTAILCISTTVTRGIKACVSTFLMCCIGAIVSTLGNIICGVDMIFLWRVPLGTAITYYLMFLCHMEDDVGGLSAGAFSAIFVQLTLFEYKPLIDHTDKKWLHTFVVRLLSVFTGCVSSFIVNSIFDIVYYKFFFKTKLRHFSNDLTLSLHEFINEPENYYLEYKYQLLNELIVDINYAIEEINYFVFKGKSIIYYTNSTNVLEHYRELVYTYLKLLNHLSFLGYQKEVMNEEELGYVKKIVKQCVMKLYAHQFNICEPNFLEKVGYTEGDNNKKMNKKCSDTTSVDRNPLIKARIDRDNSNFQESDQFNFAQSINGDQSTSINIEQINMNVVNNEHEENNIPESLRIPLSAIIYRTDKIIKSLDDCKIIKQKRNKI